MIKITNEQEKDLLYLKEWADVNVFSTTLEKLLGEDKTFLKSNASSLADFDFLTLAHLLKGNYVVQKEFHINDVVFRLEKNSLEGEEYNKNRCFRVKEIFADDGVVLCDLGLAHSIDRIAHLDSKRKELFEKWEHVRKNEMVILNSENGVSNPVFFIKLDAYEGHITYSKQLRGVSYIASAKYFEINDMGV